jgi:tetratricopeptide (TPR) repeat protein
MKALRVIAGRLGVGAEYLETGIEETELEARVAEAELALRLGESVLALELFQSLATSPELRGEPDLLWRVESGRALAAAAEGRYAEAIPALEASISTEESAVAARPDLYSALGRAYSAAGEPSRAVLLFRRCLDELARAEVVDGALYVRFATQLSYAFTDIGDLAGAHGAVTDALGHAEGLNDPYAEVRLYWSLGRLYGVQGPPEQALRYYGKAITLLEATEDRFHLARAHEACASALLDQGDPDAARPHLEISQRIYADQRRTSFLGSVRVEWARLELQEGDLETARASALEALDLLEHGATAADDVGDAWCALAEVLGRLGDGDLAEAAYLRAVEGLEAGAPVKYRADAYRSYAEFLRERGRTEEAFEFMKRAAELTITPGARPEIRAGRES